MRAGGGTTTAGGPELDRDVDPIPEQAASAIEIEVRRGASRGFMEAFPTPGGVKGQRYGFRRVVAVTGC